MKTTQAREPAYWRIEFTAWLVDSGAAFRRHSVRIVRTRTPQGAILHLRAEMRREARLSRLGDVDVEIHSLRQSTEKEHGLQIQRAVDAISQGARKRRATRRG